MMHNAKEKKEEIMSKMNNIVDGSRGKFSRAKDSWNIFGEKNQKTKDNGTGSSSSSSSVDVEDNEKNE